MLIRRLQLENFKIFHGKNVIEFEDSPNNVVVVQGDNGRGKTTVMESIFWAMYGKEKRHDKLIAPKYNRILNNLAKSQGDYFFSVTMNFDHDGKHYFLQRSVTSKRKKAPPKGNTHFKEEVKFRINGREETDHEAVLQEIFPEDIATFFFFDGETISRYAETYTDNKETIEKALGLPYLKRSREETEDIKKDLEKDLRGVRTSPTIERLEKEIATQDKRREDKAKMLGITEKILTNLTSEREKLQKALEEFEELKAIHQRIQDLEEFSQDIDREEASLKEAEAVFKAAIPSLIVRADLKAATEDVGKIKEQSVVDRINQGRLMDQKEFLEHMLTTGICLCGSEFTEASLQQIGAMVDALKEQLSQIKPVETDRYGWTQGELSDALILVKTLEKEMVNLPRLEAKRDYIEDNHLRIKKAMEAEEANLAAHSAQNRREKEVFDRLNKITQDRAIYNTKRSELKDELEAIERRQLDLEVQLRKELEMQNLDTLKLSREIDLIDRVLNAFGDVIERSAEVKRKGIQSNGSKIFHEITNKPREFVGLDIDEDTFEVKVRASDGALVGTKRLSDGEKHVVALSFLGGIKESTDSGTLIMDSPFGRLDQTHKSRLIERIGDLGEQVILLVTDEDLEPSMIDDMKGLQRRYSLDHDQTTKVSKIVERTKGHMARKIASPTDHHLHGLMNLLTLEPDWDNDNPRKGVSE